MAEDLKPLIRALSRLPVSTKETVELAVEAMAHAANDPHNEEHSTFWLVLADQLHRAGIAAPDVFRRAQALVASGADAAMMQQLGMEPPAARKRARQLAVLAQRLDEPPPATDRKRLAKPEPLVMHTGDVLAVPMSASWKTRNPYLVREDFVPSLWRPFIVLRAEHALEYLAVYCLAMLRAEAATALLPTLAELASEGPWYAQLPSTCPPAHFKRMQLQAIGRVQVDRATVSAIAPRAVGFMQHGAIQRLSIADRLYMPSQHYESFATFTPLAG